MERGRIQASLSVKKNRPLLRDLPVEKIHKGYALSELKIVRSLLGDPSRGSKDAPRSLLSNALSFVSFKQLPDSLRSHLWTLASRKKAKNTTFFSRKNFKMSVDAILLVKRTRVVSQLMVPLYGSEHTLRPCVLLEGFYQVSRQDPSFVNCLCCASKNKKNKIQC